MVDRREQLEQLVELLTTKGDEEAKLAVKAQLTTIITEFVDAFEEAFEVAVIRLMVAFEAAFPGLLEALGTSTKEVQNGGSEHTGEPTGNHR